MTAETDMMFVCDVLPSTRPRCFLRVSAWAILLAVAAVTCLSPIVLNSRILGLIVVAVWVWFERRGSGANPPLRFYREWYARRGHTSPADAVLGLQPAWLYYIVVAVIVLCPILPLTVVLVSAGLATVLWRLRRCFLRPFRGVVWEYIELVFVYLAYPDRRYSGPAGNGGLWIPAVSNQSREWVFARCLAPCYVAIAMAVMCRAAERGWSLTNSVPTALEQVDLLAALILLCTPHLLLFALQIQPLAHFLARLEPAAQASAVEWESATDLVAHSRVIEGDKALSEHFFLGCYPPAHEEANHPFKAVNRFDLPCQTPALLHRSIVHGNVHILGSTRSGKTSLGVIGLATQVIRGHTLLYRDRFGRPAVNGHGEYVWGWSDPVPMLFIDLKGDLALFHTIRTECERRGQTFHYFSLSKGLATSYFNTLTNLDIQGRPVVEFCEVVLNALSLFHGLSYGRSYYSKQSRDLALTTLKNAARKPESWEELHDLLLTEINPRKHKDVFELVSSIFALAQYPVLGPAPAGADVIHMPKVIENCEVVFASLPVRTTAMSARDVAKLLLFSFMTAAAEWNDHHAERRGYVFLDEAQIICSSNMSTLFQQCSGAKTCMILSNQARSDLNVPDAPSLSETVWVNTQLKQMFTVSDPQDAQDLIQLSGERVGVLRSYMRGNDGQGRATSSVTEKQVLHSVLTQNQINAINNDPNGSLIHVTTGAGYTQHGGIPRYIRTPYVMPYDEYMRRLHTPWPSAPETLVQNAAAKTTMVNTKDPEDVQEQAQRDYADLLEFFRQTARRAGRDRMRDWVDDNEGD